MRVIVTRPAAQAADWVRRLRERGVDAVALPLIEIAPLADATPLRDAWAALDGAALAVFVSPNAVLQFFAARPGAAGPSAVPGVAGSTAAPVDAGTAATPVGAGSTAAPVGAGTTAPPVGAGTTATPGAAGTMAAPVGAGTTAPVGAKSLAPPVGTAWPASLLAGSTGPGTTAALRDAGVAAAQIVEPAAEAGRFDSEALWQQLQARDWQGRRVVIVRGDGGRDFLATTLREHGAVVEFVTAYRRLPPAPDGAALGLVAAAAAAPRSHLWLFSSSEAVSHLLALAPAIDWRAASAAASHPRIAQAARDAGFGDVRAVAPSVDAVVALVRGPVDTIADPVTETPAPVSAPGSAPVSAPTTAPMTALVPATVRLPAAGPLPGRWIAAGAALLAAFTAAAVVYAWNAQQRVKALESELVRRQQDAGAQVTEARVAAREAQEVARESAAKLALLDARVAETSLQRSQLEELIQSLARSRDENVLADVEAAIRVAMQQTAITGSAEPLVVTLKQADERLARYSQPRLERVRRAVAQDLDKTRAAGVSDIALLAIRLDEAIRIVDELPLLASAERRSPPRAPQPAPAAAGTRPWDERWRDVGEHVWQEVRGLVRITRIEQPEAMLVAPEQAWFLRENLKLRLLNARLALLSRQFDTAQSDLRDAVAALDRYFDRGSRRVGAALELVRQVATQARLVNVPRPDATLAAIATASAGR